MPKKFPKDKKKSTLVTFRIDPDHLKHLKNKCIEMSFRDKNMYSIGTLIRETLLQAYPLPKNAQLDMFL